MIVRIPPEKCSKKINTNNLPNSPGPHQKGSSSALANRCLRRWDATRPRRNLNQRHPFDVEILLIPPDKAPYPFHSHSAQWEFYHVISGTGKVRHQDGTIEVEAGDAFLFQPGAPHQLINDDAQDLVVYVVADNPIGESCYFPDSKKWAVRSPERRVIRSDDIDYYDGEE